MQEDKCLTAGGPQTSQAIQGSAAPVERTALRSVAGATFKARGERPSFAEVPPVDSRARSAAPDARVGGIDASSCADRPTILVAEDEPGILQLLARKLEHHGYRVLTAADGAEALEVAQAREGAIDLILSDVVMPRLSGPKFVQQVLPQRPEAKVIFMSGYAREGAEGLRSVHDAAEVLWKPFPPRELVGLVDRMLGVNRTDR